MNASAGQIMESSTSQLTYVYLASAEHSGSTLMACLLDAHPFVSSIGEFGTSFNPEGMCSCGVPYDQCEFWTQWAAAAREQGIDFQLGDLGINLMPGKKDGKVADLFHYQFKWKFIDRIRDLLFTHNSYWRKRAEQAIEKSIRLAKLLCDMQQTQVFLDTTKNPYQIRFLKQHPEIDLRLIALIRDGRGMMKSVIEKEGYTPEQAVSAWLWGNRHLERAAAYLPSENVFWLRLEDLCHQPDDIIKRLLEFVGVDPDAERDYSQLHNRHIIGNRMRHTFNGEIRHDQSWRDYLTPQHLKLFEQNASWLNRRLGYSG